MSQDVYREDVVGDDIGRFAGIRCIVGNISFSQVTTIAPLYDLEFVDGNLGLYASQVATVDGLWTLRRVEGDFAINEWDAIDNLQGLELLESVGGLRIGVGRPRPQIEPTPDGGNDNLRTLQGLEGLREIRDGYVTIGDNDMLEELAGFSPAVYADGPYDLEIELNPKLPVAQIDAFEAALQSNGSDATAVDHCGNLGDAPCEQIWPD